MKKEELRKIPLKNYIKALILLIMVIIIVLYARKLYVVAEENNLNNSVLSRLVGEVKYNEFDNVFLEASEDYFMYISYLNDESIHDMENILKDLIIERNLQNNFYYLNVSDIMKEEDYLNKINNKLNLKNKIISIPTILYYEDGKFVESLNTSTSDKIFTKKEMNNFFTKYEINTEES